MKNALRAFLSQQRFLTALSKRADRGVALIITLILMGLLLVVATAFVSNMQAQRALQKSYTDQNRARDIAEAGLAHALAQLNRAYSACQQLGPGATYATMAGKFYYGSQFANIPKTSVDLYSSVAGTGLTSSPWPAVGAVSATRIADLNAGTDGQGTNSNLNFCYRPILKAGSTNDTDMFNAQITAQWLPVSTNLTGAFTASDGGMSARCGRYAFWIDDESQKINLNNAYARASVPDVLTRANGITLAAQDAPARWTNGVEGVIEPRFGDPADMERLPHRSSVELGVFASTADVNGGGGPWLTSIVYGKAWNFPPSSSEPYQGLLDGIRYPLDSNKDSLNGKPTKWYPMLSPTEISALHPQVTYANHYSPYKFCMTTWSQETNLTVFGRNRVCVGKCMTDQGFATGQGLKDANNLYPAVYNILNKSDDYGNFYGDKKSFKLKYDDTGKTAQQPVLNGSQEQIAANIVSYVSSNNVGAVHGAIVSQLPTGHYGLLKGPYMNEVVGTFFWVQESLNKPPTGLIYRYHLLAAVTVEVINPFVDLGTGGISNRTYTIMPPAGGIKMACTVQPPVDPLLPPPAAVPVSVTFGGNLTFMVGDSNAVMNATGSGNSYKPAYSPAIPYFTADATGTTASGPLTWIAKVTFQNPIEVRQAVSAKPTILQNTTQLQIPGLVMVPQGMENNPNDYMIDWFSGGQTPQGYPAGAAKNLVKWPANANGITGMPQIAPPVTPLKAPNLMSNLFANVSVCGVSMAKNDPRVHYWRPTGMVGYTGTDISLGGNNNAALDFAGGDPDPLIDDATKMPAASKDTVLRHHLGSFKIRESGMLSVGELGYIHTGRPWRTLGLQPVGKMLTKGSTKQNEVLGTDFPDWAAMDMFTTHYLTTGLPSWPTDTDMMVQGRININARGWHWGINSTTAPTAPNLPFRTVQPSTLPGFDPNSLPYRNPPSLSIAALFMDSSTGFNNISGWYRHYNVANNNVVTNLVMNIRDASPIYMPYCTVGEACEVSTMRNFNWAGNGSVNDEDSEDRVKHIASLITTRSDVFTIWVVGQSLFSPQRNDATRDKLLGAARLQVVVQRLPGPNGSGNRFHVLYKRWLAE